MGKMEQFSEAACWLALTYASGMKLARVKAIVAAWCLEGGQPLAGLFELSPADLSDRLDISVEEGEQVIAAGARLAEQATWLAQLESESTQLITRADPRYPRALLDWMPVALQPLLLFCRGDLDMLRRPSAAVIGMQDAGTVEIGFARDLATLLAEEGLTVVSGLGKGVGQTAFDAAVASEGGEAVGVLPMGINAFPGVPGIWGRGNAPPEPGQILLVSPFHPEAKFSETQAIARNKLMVGLADAVFVVAAGETGMTREAADEALRLGKTVYVWDKDPAMGPAGAGNQPLIQAGGLPFTAVPEILDAVEAIVATALERMEAAEPSPDTQPPLTTQIQETSAAYDSQAVLELLSKTGQVPEVLARRLRKGSENTS
jgi:predicted Rossmann fold nucleotide-binding protein DprA/Smf involved in DNA uptake